LGQVDRAQRVVEPPGHHAGGALEVQTQAVVADVPRLRERNISRF
jgi:hypothetical protein